MRFKRKSRGKWGILLDNFYGVLFGRVRDEKTDLNTLWDWVCIRMTRVQVKKSCKKAPKLSREEKKAVQEFYGDYIRFVPLMYHRLYKKEYGKFLPEFLLDDIYYTDIDRFYNDREAARYMDNKCFYRQLFPTIKQPRQIGMLCGGVVFGTEGEMQDIEKLTQILLQEEEVVLKKATNSEGGFGVMFLSGKQASEKVVSIFKDAKEDLILQESVKQHEELERLHPGSVNTIRVISMLRQDGVKIYSRMLRIGVGNSRVDNTCSGGILCGIHQDGCLSQRGYFESGDEVEKHPELGYALKDVKLTHVHKVDKLVREAHTYVPHFRLISWDVAIDEAGEPVLIEANLSLGGIGFRQCIQGPLFGEDTKEILDEVYANKKRKWTTLR